MSDATTPQIFQEFFFEYLPSNKQERLLEITRRRHDPLLLPYRLEPSMGRSMLGAMVIVSLLPSLLSFWLWVLSLGFLVVAIGLGALVAKYLAIRFPSFWYLHPSFLISSHEDVIRLYPWSALEHAQGHKGELTLAFPGVSLHLSCPQKNAQEYAEMALRLSKTSAAPANLLELL